MSTLSEADLRAHIRWQLETGTVPPRADNQKLYGGRGAGQACSCCDRPVGGGEVLYEIELSDQSLLAMHLQCFEMWELESQSRAEKRQQTRLLRCAF